MTCCLHWRVDVAPFSGVWWGSCWPLSLPQRVLRCIGVCLPGAAQAVHLTCVLMTQGRWSVLVCVLQGGATHFDHLGLSVRPQQGTALLFSRHMRRHPRHSVRWQQGVGRRAGMQHSLLQDGLLLKEHL